MLLPLTGCILCAPGTVCADGVRVVDCPNVAGGRVTSLPGTTGPEVGSRAAAIRRQPPPEFTVWV